jgi:hypothetical protein
MLGAMQDDTKLTAAEAGAIGGNARAKRLSATTRREIAKKAAKARWEGPILKATHGDANHPLSLGGVTIPCYVLEDGTRVLSQRGMMAGLGMTPGTTRSGADRLTSFAGGKGISPFVNAELMALIKNPIKFAAGGSIAFGYPATLLADLCDAVLAARKAGALQKQQEHIATQAEILVRGFARVGIIALVDEATGFQEARERDALAKILEGFVAKELRKWVSTFPAEYYKELFRLRGWTFPKLPKEQQRRPVMVGKITNDIVYARLAPGVREELHRVTPRDAKGRLKHKLFQRLTDDIGHPKLREHLAKVITVMQLSPDWDTFIGHMNRLMPVWKDLPLFQFLEDKDTEVRPALPRATSVS